MVERPINPYLLAESNEASPELISYQELFNTLDEIERGYNETISRETGKVTEERKKLSEAVFGKTVSVADGYAKYGFRILGGTIEEIEGINENYLPKNYKERYQNKDIRGYKLSFFYQHQQSGVCFVITNETGIFDTTNKELGNRFVHVFNISSDIPLEFIHFCNYHTPYFYRPITLEQMTSPLGITQETDMLPMTSFIQMLAYTTYYNRFNAHPFKANLDLDISKVAERVVKKATPGRYQFIGRLENPRIVNAISFLGNGDKLMEVEIVFEAYHHDISIASVPVIVELVYKNVKQGIVLRFRTPTEIPDILKKQLDHFFTTGGALYQAETSKPPLEGGAFGQNS